MCGRFTLTVDPAKLMGVFKDFTFPTQFAPRYNISPAQPILAIPNNEKNKADFFLWGLIPSWAKDPAISNKLINARGETIAEKPSFREALQYRRCLIPADGFYEWQKLGKVKQPVRIVLKSREPFALAGLWDRWRSPENVEVLSCTIITTAANDLIREIHDRMPVILDREAEAQWLDPKVTNPVQLLPLLQPYPSELMEYYLVSQQVNSPRVDKPGNIEPVPPVRP